MTATIKTVDGERFIYQNADTLYGAIKSNLHKFIDFITFIDNLTGQEVSIHKDNIVSIRWN